MIVRSLMVASALLAGLELAPEAMAIEIPPRKVEINKFTCGEFSSLQTGEERDRVLIYMNGYLDGTRKTTVWDATPVGKRIEEVVRLCREDPKLTLLNAFKRAWRQLPPRRAAGHLLTRARSASKSFFIWSAITRRPIPRFAAPPNPVT
jgi:hypothetical protein